jgi:type VI secretion system protein VasI
MKNRTTLIALTLAVAGTALVGCNGLARIESPTVFPTEIEPLDVRVGVYFSPEFESFTHEQEHKTGMGYPVRFELGPPSQELFSQLFEAMFRETVLVNSPVPMSYVGIPLDAIIEPKIIDFEAAFQSENYFPIQVIVTAWVNLTYEVVLSSPDGFRIATWSARFQEQEEKSWGFPKSMAGNMINKIMRETSAGFIAEFPENKDVAQWLESTLNQNLDWPQIQPTSNRDKGKWKVSVETNPSDDSTTDFLILTADSGTSNFGQPTSLEVQCKSNKTKLYINWKSFLGSKASVLTRIGSEKAQTKDWELSTDSQSSLFPGDTISFLKKIMASDKLLAQVSPYIGNPITAIFDTRGINNAIKPIRETCGW